MHLTSSQCLVGSGGQQGGGDFRGLQVLNHAANDYFRCSHTSVSGVLDDPIFRILCAIVQFGLILADSHRETAVVASHQRVPFTKPLTEPMTESSSAWRSSRISINSLAPSPEYFLMTAFMMFCFAFIHVIRKYVCVLS